MQPDKIETKRLRLVGVEMYINLQEKFTHKLNAIYRKVIIKYQKDVLGCVRESSAQL